MGFRFRRSLKLIPGVRLNVGLKSASLSFGTRGLHYTVSTKGQRLTTGLPGSGISYTHYSPWRTRTNLMPPPLPSAPGVAAPPHNVQPTQGGLQTPQHPIAPPPLPRATPPVLHLNLPAPAQPTVVTGTIPRVGAQYAGLSAAPIAIGLFVAGLVYLGLQSGGDQRAQTPATLKPEPREIVRKTESPVQTPSASAATPFTNSQTTSPGQDATKPVATPPAERSETSIVGKPAQSSNGTTVGAIPSPPELAEASPRQPLRPIPLPRSRPRDLGETPRAHPQVSPER
jgi:hypothetical protein